MSLRFLVMFLSGLPHRRHVLRSILISQQSLWQFSKRLASIRMPEMSCHAYTFMLAYLTRVPVYRMEGKESYEEDESKTAFCMCVFGFFGAVGSMRFDLIFTITEADYEKYAAIAPTVYIQDGSRSDEELFCYIAGFVGKEKEAEHILLISGKERRRPEKKSGKLWEIVPSLLWRYGRSRSIPWQSFCKRRFRSV